MSKAAIFIHPNTKAEISLPEIIQTRDEKLKFVAQKTAGWSTGGWYADSQGRKFLAKFGSAINRCVPYVEKLLNDLEEACIDKEFIGTKVLIGHGELAGKSTPCLLVLEIPNYRDLMSIEGPGKTEAEAVALRKPYAPSLHRFYPFFALIGNDDLNEENLGLRFNLDGGFTPMAIDFGLIPTYLSPQQIAHAATPFHLASFIGHRNLNLMQLVRRRYFGHDSFINPDDRLKPQKEKLKAEDINYLDLLLGIKKIIAAKEKMMKLAHDTNATVLSDESLEEKEKDFFLSKFANFSEILGKRISWMKENFGADLEKLDDEQEQKRFAAIKWRLHPKFSELMEFENAVFKEAAQVELNSDFEKLSKLLAKSDDQKRSREEILELDLQTVKKSVLQEAMKGGFALHNALIAGDFELAKWLARNEICDGNFDRKSREHNYQLFRTTPLHAAVAIYHDCLFYQRKDELEPLRATIDVLKEKFFEKNGEKFDETRDYGAEGLDHFAIKLTFVALERLEQSLAEVAATKIQRTFRAHHAERIAKSQTNEAVKS